MLAEDVKEGDGEKDVEMVNPDAPSKNPMQIVVMLMHVSLRIARIATRRHP